MVVIASSKWLTGYASPTESQDEICSQPAATASAWWLIRFVPLWSTCGIPDKSCNAPPQYDCLYTQPMLKARKGFSAKHIRLKATSQKPDKMLPTILTSIQSQKKWFTIHKEATFGKVFLEVKLGLHHNMYQLHTDGSWFSSGIKMYLDSLKHSKMKINIRLRMHT